MKSKSALIFISGIAVGVIGGFLFTPQKSLKKRKEISKKAKKYKKAFKETANKYKEKLEGLQSDNKI